MEYYRPDYQEINSLYKKCESDYAGKTCNYILNTYLLNGYIMQSLNNNSYSFEVFENIEMKTQIIDFYSILILKRNNYYSGLAFTKLEKDSKRICFSSGHSLENSGEYNMNNIWIDFYLYECQFKMSKNDLIERFKDIYNKISTSFDDNFDKGYLASKRELEEKKKALDLNNKREMQNSECYYYESVGFSNYEGYFIKENTFTIIFVDYNNQQFKVVIPFTDSCILLI